MFCFRLIYLLFLFICYCLLIGCSRNPIKRSEKLVAAEPNLELSLGNIYSGEYGQASASSSSLQREPAYGIAGDVAESLSIPSTSSPASDSGVPSGAGLVRPETSENTTLALPAGGAREEEHFESLCARGHLEVNGDELTWNPTIPTRGPTGERRYAGWYDTASDTDKARIAKYLDPLWQYSQRQDNCRQTRKRMRAKIGPMEAFYLRDAERYPRISQAIAISTISNQKDPSNVLHSARGRYLMEVLVTVYKMNPKKAAHHVRRVLAQDTAATTLDEVLIHAIVSKCNAAQERKAARASRG